MDTARLRLESLAEQRRQRIVTLRQQLVNQQERLARREARVAALQKEVTDLRKRLRRIAMTATRGYERRRSIREEAVRPAADDS